MSWASGRWLSSPKTGRFAALRVYALIELLIGISGIIVPYAFVWGRRLLEHSALSSSFGYYSVTGLWVGISVVPWCALMGATVPVAMRAIGQTIPSECAAVVQLSLHRKCFRSRDRNPRAVVPG